MKYFELRLTLQMQIDLPLKKTPEKLSQSINSALARDDYLRAIHAEKGFKPYSFGGLPFPPEKEMKVYGAYKLYMLSLRTHEKRMADALVRVLDGFRDSTLAVLAVQKTEKSFTYVETLRTLSPAIFTFTNREGKLRNWTTDEGDILTIRRRVLDNLEKKHRALIGEIKSAPEDAITLFESLNKRAVVFDYKQGKLLGNKFRMSFNSDTTSQQLAYCAMVFGVGEKNALGFGGCGVAPKLHET